MNMRTISDDSLLTSVRVLVSYKAGTVTRVVQPQRAHAQHLGTLADAVP